MGNKNRRKKTAPDSYVTHITLMTGEELTENERQLLDLQIRWVCESQLIPIEGLIIGGKQL